MTAEELRVALNGMGDNISPEECERLIMSGDIDQDGKLNFEEVVYTHPSISLTFVTF